VAAGDASLAGAAMQALPPTPTSAGWVNYVRCHDDIGWAVSDTDATAVGLSGPAHREFLARFYRGDFWQSFADGVPFSSNPDNGDERTCGTAAALCGVGKAARTGDPAALDLAVRRLELLYGVMFGFPGVPLVYMGDELALDNDAAYLGDPSRADDSRWIHRPEMPWNIAERRGVEGSLQQRVFSFVQQLAATRVEHPALSAGGEVVIHRHPDSAVFAWALHHPNLGRFYGMANFAARAAMVPALALEWAGMSAPRAVLGADLLYRDHPANWTLDPYAVVWFVDDDDTVVQPAV
jgi:amylosucrase